MWTSVSGLFRLAFFFNFIEVQLIYNVVLVSSVQKIESYLHIPTIFFFLDSFPIQAITEYQQCSLCYIASSSVQFSSVVQSCPTLCDPMNHSMPGLPVHHQLPEFTQTHVHRVNDAIQPSHPLASPSPPAPNASQHQGLLQ